MKSHSESKQLKDALCYDFDDQYVKCDKAGNGVLYVWKLRLTNLEDYFQILKMFAIGNSAYPLCKTICSHSEFKQLKDALCQRG